MRKLTVHTFLLPAALIVLLATSCLREEFERELPGRVQEEVQDGDQITLEGSICLPMASDGMWGGTKAFGETPRIAALYVAVFNGGDILYEIKKANPGTQSHPTTTFNPASEAEDYLTYFNVTLTAVNNGNRYVHFIAVSDTLKKLEMTDVDRLDESTFVKDLVTRFKPDEGVHGDHVVAYWGRKFYQSITPTTPMQRIPMTRNFAKVKLDVPDSISTHFKVYGFKVFDTPKSGTVAPFNNNEPEYIYDSNNQASVNFDRFADFASAEDQAQPYSYMSGNGAGQKNYQGFMPTDIQYNDWSDYYDASGTDNVIWLSPSEPDYLYECSYRSDRNPCMILKAKYSASEIANDADWNSVPYSYYKADFVYTTEDGNVYYNILRNFLYTLHISNVNAPGSATVYDAYNGIALNNFQASTQSQLLTNIADDSSRLFVSQTDFLITSGTTFTLYVKSRLVGSGDFDVVDPDPITASVRDAVSGNRIVANNAAISISSSAETSGTWTGWHKVTITCANSETLHQGEVWKQPIVFKNGAGLTRTVNLTLRKPFSLSVDVQDYVAPVKDTEVTLDFSVPAGLTAARFPLYFYVEQEDNTLYPKPLESYANETLSVESGPTLIPGHTGNNYYYRRSISWAEYSAAEADINGIKTFRCYFKTLVNQSATTVWVVASPNNDFYYPVDDVNNSTNRDTFANTMEEGNLYFSFYGMQLNVGGTAVNKATSNSGAPISYSTSDPLVATVDAEGKVTGVGTGTATITATAPSYKHYSEPDPVSYTVTVTADALSELSVNWSREPVFVVKKNSTVRTQGAYSVKNGYSGTVTATYESDNTAVATVDADGTVHGVAAGYALITYRVNASGGGCANASQAVSYEIQVVDNKAASGTIHHEETFLDGTMGDYYISFRKVTDGETWQSGNDRTADFEQYTWFSASSCYRSLWYPYYYTSTGLSYGVAQSAWGAIEAPTSRWDVATSEWVTDYHNARFAAYSELTSQDIDLSCSASSTLTFYHAGNYFYTRTNMQNDAKVYFSKDGGSTWSSAVDINYPPGSNWIYIKAQVSIPTEYLTSQFRIRFACESFPDHFVQLHYTDDTYTETTTSVTSYPVYYDVITVGSEERQTTSYTHEVTPYPVMVTLDDGRAGTWEIKNLTIVED